MPNHHSWALRVSLGKVQTLTFLIVVRLANIVHAQLKLGVDKKWQEIVALGTGSCCCPRMAWAPRRRCRERAEGWGSERGAGHAWRTTCSGLKWGAPGDTTSCVSKCVHPEFPANQEREGATLLAQGGTCFGGRWV